MSHPAKHRVHIEHGAARSVTLHTFSSCNHLGRVSNMCACTGHSFRSMSKHPHSNNKYLLLLCFGLSRKFWGERERKKSIRICLSHPPSRSDRSPILRNWFLFAMPWQMNMCPAVLAADGHVRYVVTASMCQQFAMANVKNRNVKLQFTCDPIRRFFWYLIYERDFVVVVVVAEFSFEIHFDAHSSFSRSPIG